MLLLLGLTTLLWYRLEIPRAQAWQLPLWVLAGVAVLLLLLRLELGLRWRELSRETRLVLVSALLLFALLWWFGRVDGYARYWRTEVPDTPLAPLHGFMYLSASSVLLRTVVPLGLILLLHRRRPADYGYRLRGTFELAWVYALLTLAIAALVVFYASGLPAFVARYPLGRALIHDGQMPLWSFLVYQFFYLLVFVSGESFWRGYLLFGLERELGRLALLVMIIPYTMAHFGKPLPEALGAMAAGLTLGYLALRHRSFWLGVAAHYGIALTMDLAALWRRGVEIVG